MSTLGDSKDARTHLKNKHNPALLKVLAGEVTLAAMEDDEGWAPSSSQLSADACRDAYEEEGAAAPTPVEAIAHEAHKKILPSAAAFVAA